MKVTIEVDLLDKDIKELNGLRYNLNDATEIKVSFDYGDKIIYCDGCLGSIIEKVDE